MQTFVSRRSAIKSALAIATLGASTQAETLHIGGATLKVSLGSGACDLPASALLDWISTAANALTAYFGKFPVASARIEITIAPDRHGVMRGKSFGDDGALTTDNRRSARHRYPSCTTTGS